MSNLFGIAPSNRPAGHGAYGLVRAVFISLAVLLLSVGLVGIVVPGLPATPFLLLASYFLARSSPRLHAALLRSAVVGPILRDWQRRRGVRPRVKLQAAAAVVVGVALTSSLSGLTPGLRLIVILCAAVGLVVIQRLPSVID